MKFKSSCLAFLIVMFLMSIDRSPLAAMQNASAAGKIIRVTVDGSNSGSTCGLDWNTPCNFQYALLSRAAPGDEIWVKAGTYLPTDIHDRSVSFFLKNSVQIYGGFSGNESDRNKRNWVTNQTILSGNIGIDHSYHVVQSEGGNSDTILDGFTISFGQADGGGLCPGPVCGGGILIINSNPTLANILFKGNSALGPGGAMVNFNSNSKIENVIFNENSSGYNGGGIYNLNSNPSFSNVTISENSAFSGGGVFNQNSNPSFSSVAFSNNRSTPTDGTGGGGGIYNDYLSNPVFFNVSFSGNSAGKGGAIFNYNSNITVTNATFRNNFAQYFGSILTSYYSNSTFINITSSDNTCNNIFGGFYRDGGSLTMKNSVLWDDFPGGLLHGYENDPLVNISKSIIRGGWPGENLNSDPHLGTPGYYGGFTEFYPLELGSPAIDAVPVTACKMVDGSPLTIDQRGVSRPQAFGCDMGAFEVLDSWTLKTYLPIIMK